MAAYESEVEKAFGDLRVTLVCNRDGVLCAFGLNGVKKAGPKELQTAILWLDLCKKHPSITPQGQTIFGDIKRILETQLSVLF